MILHCEYAKQGLELDEPLKKAVGRDSCSSGYGFVDSVRDIQFEFTCLKELKAAQERIKADPMLMSVTCKAQD